MTSIHQATEIAQKFVKSQGEILPGIFYGMDLPQDFQECFYFDFLLVNAAGETPDDCPRVGGAPGFIVHKRTGEVEVISFATLAGLRRNK